MKHYSTLMFLCICPGVNPESTIACLILSKSMSSESITTWTFLCLRLTLVEVTSGSLLRVRCNPSEQNAQVIPWTSTSMTSDAWTELLNTSSTNKIKICFITSSLYQPSELRNGSNKNAEVNPMPQIPNALQNKYLFQRLAR